MPPAFPHTFLAFASRTGRPGAWHISLAGSHTGLPPDAQFPLGQRVHAEASFPAKPAILKI